jgi:hypothetical protein
VTPLTLSLRLCFEKEVEKETEKDIFSMTVIAMKSAP